MQTVYELNGLRIIDLTKYIDPARPPVTVLRRWGMTMP